MAFRAGSHTDLDFPGLESVGQFDARLESLPEGGAVVRVRGDLDMATSPVLAERLSEAPNADPLVLDLSQCSLVDSAGLRAIVRASKEAAAAGRRFAVVVNDPAIRRVLEITAVDNIVPIHATLEAAL